MDDNDEIDGRPCSVRRRFGGDASGSTKPFALRSSELPIGHLRGSRRPRGPGIPVGPRLTKITKSPGPPLLRSCKIHARFCKHLSFRLSSGCQSGQAQEQCFSPCQAMSGLQWTDTPPTPIGANLPSGNISPLEPSFPWPFGKIRRGKFPGVRNPGHSNEAANSLGQDGQDPDGFTPQAALAFGLGPHRGKWRDTGPR